MKYLGLLLLAVASLTFASNPEQYQDQQQYQGQKQSTESSARAHGGDADVDNTVKTHVSTTSEGGTGSAQAVSGDSTSNVGDVANSGNNEVTVQSFGDEGDTVNVGGDTTSISYDFPVNTAIAPSALNNSACGRTLGGAYQGEDAAGGIGLPLGNDPDCEQRNTASLIAALGHPGLALMTLCHTDELYEVLSSRGRNRKFLGINVTSRRSIGKKIEECEDIVRDLYSTTKDPEVQPSPVALSFETVRMDLAVEFEYDSDVVTGNYYDNLREVAEFMNEHKTASLVVEGHTDNRASDAYNQDLSARRALAVRDILIQEFGISSSRIGAVGYGESKLIDFTETEAGHQRNRRVVGEITTQVIK